jgi:hypothetical protein
MVKTGIIPQKRKRLFQSAARFQGFSLFGYFDGQVIEGGQISGQLVLEVRDIDDDLPESRTLSACRAHIQSWVCPPRDQGLGMRSVKGFSRVP